MSKYFFFFFVIIIGSSLSIIAESTLPSLSIELTPTTYHILPPKKKPVSAYQSIPYAIGTVISSWKKIGRGYAGFQAGNCTDYAATKKPYLFIRKGKRLITGDAKEWLSKAKKFRIATGKIPKKGSIAVFYPGKGAGDHGHVAYVEAVDSDGSILISDMNYQGENIVTKRVISSSLAAGYIY